MKSKYFFVIILLFCLTVSGCTVIKTVDHWIQEHMW